ncbi:hypothetical protein POM88_018540 [Heracleum sosnowskyi]|uniref:Uncharacterized protein n=1 Tax=Heracleum sosnowskyi TaxID=360622 RepID=A0AAD8MZF6_9APIA|nr:hypothetical protein POM88_018540 [Heracleum sosnowskyi]
MEIFWVGNLSEEIFWVVSLFELSFALGVHALERFLVPVHLVPSSVPGVNLLLHNSRPNGDGLDHGESSSLLMQKFDLTPHSDYRLRKPECLVIHLRCSLLPPVEYQ